MIIKLEGVSQTRYFSEIKNLRVSRNVFNTEKELEEMLDYEHTTCGGDVEYVSDVLKETINFDIVGHILKSLYFESKDGIKNIVTLNNVYLINDEGKTIERIN